MTPDDGQDLASSAFLGIPVNDPPNFAFRMTIGYRIYGAADGSADGMVFVMHRDPREATAIGNRGGGIGVYGSLEETIRPAVAIEWDTFFNPGRQDNGQNRIHIVQVNDDPFDNDPLDTLAQTDDDSRVQNVRTGDFDGETGTIVGRMWVDYNCNGNKRLEVRVDPDGQLRPTFADLAVDNVRLEDFFFPDGDNGIVYVGYTASIGGQADNHDIFGWEFDTGCTRPPS